MALNSGGTVTWNIDADSSQFDKGLSAASTKAKKFGSDLNNIDFKGVTSNASTAFGNIANGIESVVKKVALLTAGSGGIGAVFLKSAADLQVTSKSLEVLTGNTAVANKLFADLAKFANETPFEFPEIAKAGKTLLGFGIGSGDVLGRVKMLGDIAAATGADFNSLAVVFGQVNATGRLMGQDALQLINNNIPITTILAKKLGISVQDVKARMEQGAIGVDVFNQALEETTQKGGFAFKGTEQLALTLNGRISTLKDTVLEFGRNLLGVKVDPELGLTVKPGGLFDRFSQLVPRITAGLAEITPKITAFVDTIVRNGPTIVAVLGGIAAAFIAAKVAAVIFAIAAAINPFTLIAAGIVALVGVLAFLQIKFNIFGKALKILHPVIAIISGVLKELWKSVSDLAKVLGQELAPVFKFVADHAAAFKKIGVVLLGVVLAPLIIGIGLLIGTIKLLAVFIGFIAHHFETIKQVVLTVMTVALSPLILAIGAVVIAVKFIIEIVKALIGAFEWVVGAVVATKDAVVGAWQVIHDMITGIVQKIIDFFAPAFNWLLDRGKDIVIGLATGISSAASAVWNAIKAVADQIGNFFAGAWNWLYDTGKAIVEGMVRGIKDTIGKVKDAAGEIGDAVKNKVKNVLGINSPSKVFAEYGKNVAQGFVNGIASSKDMVDMSLSTMSAGASPTIAPNVSAGFGEPSDANSNEYHIGTINIAKEADGESWLKKLTRNQEIFDNGLTPSRTAT